MNYKKIIFVISFLATFGFLFWLAPNVKAQTVAELQALIQQLQAQIVALQQQLAQLQGQPAAWCHDFNTNLRIGDSGSEVTALQTVLQKEGFLTEITNEFDEKTASAVVGFQEKYASEILTPLGLTHGTGFVGKSTRAKLNNLYGCGTIKPPLQTLYRTKFNIESLYSNLLRSDDNGKTWKTVYSQYKGEIIYVTDPKNPKNIYVGDKSGNMMAPNLGIDLLKSFNGGDTWIDISKGVIRKEGLYQYIEGTKTLVTGIDNIWVDLDFNHLKVTVKGGGESFIFESTDGGNTWKQIKPPTYPSITVLSPNGGEKWETGRRYEIMWNSKGVDSALIELEKGSEAWHLAYNVDTSLGKYYWTIPNSITPGDNYKIKIIGQGNAAGVEDESDNYFSIVAAGTPSITSVFPNWGKSGDIITIYGKNLVNISKVEFLKDGVVKGSQSSGISSSPDGSYLKFTLSGLFTENSETGIYQIRVVNNYGVSNTLNFTIWRTQPSITVLSPNGEEEFIRGSTMKIRWEPGNAKSSSVLLEIRKGDSPYVMITSSAANTGYYNWPIPSTFPIGNDYKIRVTDYNDRTIFDESDSYFSIVDVVGLNNIENQLADISKAVSQLIEQIKNLGR